MMTRSEITSMVDSMPVYSDHEHHQPDAFFAEGMNLDKVLNHSYVGWMGFPADGTEEGRKRLLDNVRFNSYFIWLERGLQRLHGIDDPITLETWQTISDRIASAHGTDPEFHWKSLQEHGYERLIQDSYWNPGDDNGHPELFATTFRIDKFMYGYHRDIIAPDNVQPWSHYGFDGGTLDDYVALMGTTIQSRVESGSAVALKCAEAYNRPISFTPDDRDTAEAIFGRRPESVDQKSFYRFGNYIFHRCCELAGELDIPLQVHTGLARLGGSSPMNLLPIIEAYPTTRFVLFHSGYPWTQEVAALAHNYPNVFPSLTWTATICTNTAIRTLHDYIEVSPSINRITWGSDCWTPEESIGAQLAWRYIVARVIFERIEHGMLRAAEADLLARKLLFENGRTIYGKGKL